MAGLIACLSIDPWAMLFAVIKLRKEGRALTRAELDQQARAVGDLRFEDPPHPRGIKRLVLLAELYGLPMGGVPQTIISPLMNPMVVEVNADAMVLFGLRSGLLPVSRTRT